MFYINWKTNTTNLVIVACEVKFKISNELTHGIQKDQSGVKCSKLQQEGDFQLSNVVSWQGGHLNYSELQNWLSV